VIRRGRLLLQSIRLLPGNEIAMAESTLIEPAKRDEGATPTRRTARRSPPSRLRWGLLTLLLVLLAGGGALYWARSGKGESKREQLSSGGSHPAESHAPVVQILHAHRGGLERTTNQPGTIRAKEYAALFAKVSGYLKELNVDRGDRVKKGQLLALVYDPELDVAVLQAEASLQHSEAVAKQAQARIKTAEAGVKAAEAKRKEADSIVEEAVAQRTYRKKALDRLSELASRNGIEQRVVDEAEDQYMASLASEHAAHAGVLTADAKLAESQAALELAHADLVTAQAEVKVAQAMLDKAKVMLSYTRIESPYDGVITDRAEGLHVGSFIRSAADGNAAPLLTVAWTDVMRTIVQVPDPDVPFANAGDPASVTLDPLKGRVFKGKISRMGEKEDLKDRTMRVEVDLPNKDGVLKDGMFGRVLIELEPPSQNLTIPSTCLIEQSGTGEGAVYVVREGKVRRVPIRVGRDNGLRVEILSGLTEKDEIVAQITPSIADGVAVKTESAESAEKRSSHQ
jgi:RND family efflux transporter MFP subunit